MKLAVRGFKDICRNDLIKFRHIESTCSRLAKLYGYTEIIPNLVEREELFVRSVGADSDIISKEIYRLTTPSSEAEVGTDKSKLVLRPEATASTIRYLLEQPEILQQSRTRPLKLFYCGPMFRHDRPQKGRLRQFFQFGIEHIGSDSVTSDCENIILADAVLKELGVSKYRLHVNSIGDQDTRHNYNEALHKYFSLPNVYAKLSKESKAKVDRRLPLLRVLDSKDPDDISSSAGAPKICDFLSAHSRSRLEHLSKTLSEHGVAHFVDSTLVRGLDYYNDVCYEFKTEHENLGPSQNTIIGGGRYDGLAEMIGARQTVPAAGWAAGLNRLLEIIPMPENRKENKADIVLALDKSGDKDSVYAYALKVAQFVRSKGMITSVHYVHTTLRSQLTAAETEGSKTVIIVGCNECKNQTVTLRNMKERTSKTIPFSELSLQDILHEQY